MTTATRTFEVEVPMQWRPGKPPVPLLTANDRLHWRAAAKRTQTIRNNVAWRAKQAKIPACAHITVTLHYRPGDSRRRDPSNLMATQKPAVDGLVDAKVVPDDTPQFVTERVPVIDDGPGERRLWLEIEVTQ